MAKCEDIVKQLRAVLPKYDSRFVAYFPIASLSRDGEKVTIVTQETALEENLDLIKDGTIIISGTATENRILSLTRSGRVATCIVESWHDFTENFNMYARITGANETDWNNDFKILKVIDEKTFTMEVPSTLEANPSGELILLEVDRVGFNGSHKVTKKGTETYEFDLSFENPDILPETANVENGKFVYGYRIAGIGYAENISRFYTQTENKTDRAWLFVLLGDTSASKDRKVSSDAISKIQGGSNFEQEIYQSFSVFAIIPQNTTNVSARNLRDEMEELRVGLFKSLLGVTFDSYLISGGQYQCVFQGDAFINYNGAYYIHRFDFQNVFLVQSGIDGNIAGNINGDIVEPIDTAAYRFFEIDWQNENDVIAKIIKGTLPQKNEEIPN